MTILWVVPLLAVAVLLFALAYGQMRRPDPSAFFSSESTASGVAYLVTAALGFAVIGAAMNWAVLWQAFLGLPYASQAAHVAVLVGAVLLTPMLMRPAFRRPQATGGAEIVPLTPRGPVKAGGGKRAAGAKRKRAA